MNELLVSLVSVFFLGVITTIQPCPLTLNISIISLITGAPYQQKHFYKAVIGFATGYFFAFLVLAFVISVGMSTIVPLSIFLQTSFSPFIGPLLILVGMMLSKLINLDKFHKGIRLTNKLWLVNGALFPSFLMGGLLAMSFCPSTASIFFGIMLPISVKHDASMIFPLVYATGALLPLFVVAYLIRRGLSGLLPDFWINRLPQFIGGLLILIGLYITVHELYLN